MFKLIIIGDSGNHFIYIYFSLGIGKSCVLKRLVENEFKEDHDVTVGVEFGSYLIRVQDKILKL
jgi:Ras-related protein Rab-2A